MRAEIVKSPRVALPHPTEERPLAVGDVIDVLPLRGEEARFVYLGQATRDDGPFRWLSFLSLSAEYVEILPEMDLRRRGIIRSASFASGEPARAGGLWDATACDVMIDDPIGPSISARPEAKTPGACTCPIADLMTRGCTCGPRAESP